MKNGNYKLSTTEGKQKCITVEISLQFTRNSFLVSMMYQTFNFQLRPCT